MDSTLYPISFDAAGAKANMRVFLDIAELQAKGTPARDAKRIIQDRYKNGTYQAPERAGLSYMLCKIKQVWCLPRSSSLHHAGGRP